MSDTSLEKYHSNGAATRVQCNISTSNPSSVEVTPSAATRVQHTESISYPSPEEVALLRLQLQECEQEKLELENENASYLTAITRLQRAAKKPTAQSVAFDPTGYEAKIKELENQLHTAVSFRQELESQLLAAESSRQHTPSEEELKKLLDSREQNFQDVRAEQDHLIGVLQAEDANLVQKIRELEERDPEGEKFQRLDNSLQSAYNEVEDLKSTVKKSSRSSRALTKQLGRLRSDYHSLHDRAVEGFESYNKLVANLTTLQSLNLENLGPRDSSKLGRLDNTDQESINETGPQVREPSEDIKPQDLPFEGTSQSKISIQEEATETGSSKEPSEVLGSQDQQNLGTSPPARSRPSSPPTATQNLEVVAGTDTQVGPLLGSIRGLGLQDQRLIGAAPPARSRPSSVSRASSGTPQPYAAKYVPRFDESTGPPSPSLGSPSLVGLGLLAGDLTARRNRRGKSWAESSSGDEEASETFARKPKSVAPSAPSTSMLQVEAQQPKTEEEAKAPRLSQFQAEERAKFKPGKEVEESSTAAKKFGQTVETEGKKVEETYSTELTGPKPAKPRTFDEIHAAEIKRALGPIDWDALLKMTPEQMEARRIAHEKKHREENPSFKPANRSSEPQPSKPKSTVNQTGYQKAVSGPPPPSMASVQTPSTTPKSQVVHSFPPIKTDWASQKMMVDHQRAMVVQQFGATSVKNIVRPTPEQVKVARAAALEEYYQANPSERPTSGLSETRKRKETSESAVERENSIAKKRKNPSNSRIT